MAFLDLILLVIIVYTVSKWIWKGNNPKLKKPPAQAGGQTVEEMKQDPVCGTYVPVSLAVTALHKGTTMYFCSSSCRDKFSEKTKTN